jgi:TatD DNase family protein
MFFDSHAHITGELYLEAEEIVNRARKADIEGIINICTDATSLEEGLELKKRYPFIYLSGAVTPHDVEKLGEELFASFSHHAEQGDFVAIGETGLDYYYLHSPKKQQQASMEKYLHLAEKTNLPVIFHCREAFDDLFNLTKDLKVPAVLHCFTGTLKEAKQVIDRGWMISFSGIVTFKKSDALREIAKEMPLEQMFIETDAPYLAPQSKRGKRNEPSYITETAQCLAEVKNISLEEIASVTTGNVKKFFNIM